MDGMNFEHNDPLHQIKVCIDLDIVTIPISK
jgi:hypothetical protein